jgi:hypothetical protein
MEKHRDFNQLNIILFEINSIERTQIVPLIVLSTQPTKGADILYLLGLE